MVLLVIYVLGFLHTSPPPCCFGKRELTIALNALYSRRIIVLDSNQLNINTLEIDGFELSGSSHVTWQVGNKTVQNIEYNRNTPWVKFSTGKLIAGSDFTLCFSTIEGGRRSKGTITFTCENDSLFFKNMQYATSIE